MRKIILTKKQREKLLEMGVTGPTIRNWTSGRTDPTPHYCVVLEQVTGKKYTKKKKAA